MKLFVLDGWAAPPDTWSRCTFPRDRLFDYVEQLDGLPERALDATDAAILVGFSMGGSGALRLFLRAPQKVRGLVLVSASPRMMEEPSDGWRGLTERRFAALRLGAELTFHDNPSPLYAETNLARGLAYLRETDLRDDLLASAAPQPPVSIFQSERDGIVRPEQAAFLARVFPKAAITLVPGNEHTLPRIIPEQIDAAVYELLSNDCGGHG